MGGKTWSEAEREQLARLAGEGLTTQEMREHFPGRSEQAIRQMRQNMGLPTDSVARFFRTQHGPTLTRVVSETPERVVIAPEESASREAAEVWQAAERQTNRDIAKARAENIVTVRIMTDKPVALSISSDWHLRTRGAVWLQALREYAEAVRDTPGLYAIAVGDLLDNPIKWEKDLSEVPDDLLLLAHIFGVFGYKLLGTTDGNHDAWTRQFAGIDALKWLAERERIHYAPDELIYIVELVDPRSQERTARYVIATRHQYYRHSNLNPSHACFRWLEDRVGQWPVGEDGGELIPDVLAIGHNHVACCDVRSFFNKDIWGARMGAFQLTTGHGRQGGWRWSPPTTPIFILYPHRSSPVWGTVNPDQALRFLAAERQAWAA